MFLAASEDLCWLLPLGVVSVVFLWVYLTWFRHASEALVFRWAEEHGLRIVSLDQTRRWWRNPPGVRVGRYDLLFHFAAKAADGSRVEGWITVGTTPMSLKPNQIRVVIDGPGGGGDPYA